MRPFPGKMTEKYRVFNYRLSRARRVIENCFGILVARRWIISSLIETSMENAEKYTLACIAMNNYLRLTYNPNYCPNLFVDCTDGTENYKRRGMKKNCCWKVNCRAFQTFVVLGTEMMLLRCARV